ARRPNKMPTVLMGDTNEWRTEAGCLREIEPEFHLAPTGASFHARHPVAALDRIIVHKDLNIEAAGVHMSPAARRASDHLPIWARISTVPRTPRRPFGHCGQNPGAGGDPLAGDFAQPPPLDRRADPHRLAVFDDGAA